MDSEDHPIAVRFFNNHLIRLSKLNIKAFYATHMCLNKCYTNESVKGEPNMRVKECIKDCDNELNEYFRELLLTRPYEA